MREVIREYNLTNAMGCGKSTIGRILAEKFGYSFFDTDETCRQKLGITIPYIFESIGDTAK